MKKILIIQNEFGLSGSPMAAFNLALYLKNNDYKVQVISPSSGHMQQLYNNHQIENAIVPEVSSNLDITYKYVQSFDLVIVFCLPQFGAVLASVNAKKPTIFAIHEAEAGGMDIIKTNAIAQRALDLATCLVFNSEYCKNLYQHRNINKITKVIPIGTQPVVITGEKQPNPKKIFIQIGSVERRKGQDIAIKAFKSLENKAELHIIGRILDQNYMLELHKIIDKQTNVKFGGECEPLKALSLLAGADGLIVASRDETLPNVILEAMNLGIPVISSDVGAIREVIKHNTSGLMFFNEDVAELENCVKRVSMDNDLRGKLIHNAKALIQSERMVEHYGSKYLSLIEELLRTT